MKLIIMGLARHGKDEVCKILETKGYSSRSSSDVANELIMFPKFSGLYGYKTLEECFADRVNKRSEWYNAICEYNKEDKARLGKLILNTYDIYCGLRNIEELLALKNSKQFDIVTIWVDALQRKEITETKDSITVSQEDCDYHINNNGTIQDLENRVESLARLLKYLK